MMQLPLFKIVVVLVYLNLRCFADDLPDFIHVCHRDHADLNKCLIAAVEELRPYLQTGVAEYNIPSLEPLIMKDLFSEHVAGMKICVSNVSAYGCNDFFVREINVDLDTLNFNLDLDIPRLRILAHYSVDGKLLLLPVKGDGNLEANISGVFAQTTLFGEVFEKDGENYMKFNTCNLKVTISGGGVARLENMFDNNQILLQMVNDVVNKNWDSFLRELLPVIERALEATILEIANKIVQPFTYKQLFPH